MSQEFFKNLVQNITPIDTRGPWKSKSGGELNVLLALSRSSLHKFLDYDNPEFDRLPEDLRGLRTYTVSDIPKNSVGGGEWHKARTEYIGALAGSALLQCVDFSGNEQEFILNGHSSIIMPPGILHTYTALEDSTTLQVLANTLFIPEDSRTHDTYSAESFYKLIH